MKKYIILAFATFFLATIAGASALTISNDGYTQWAQTLRNGHTIALSTQAIAQNFSITTSNGANYTVDNITSRVMAAASSSGNNLRATIYASDGAGGPTGSALAVSNLVANSGLPTACTGARTTFEFNDSSLASGTPYIFVITYNASTNNPSGCYNATGTYSGGNGTWKADGGATWSTITGSSADLDFSLGYNEIAGFLIITAVDSYNSTAINEFNATVVWNGTTTNYSTTNGTITTTAAINSSLTANVTVTPTQTNYFAIPQTFTNYNTTTLQFNATPVTYISFIGSISGITYYPVCSVNGSTINTAPGYQPTFTNYTTYIQCAGGDTYIATNFTVTQTQQNWVLELEEYSINLAFSSNTTGTINWANDYSLYGETGGTTNLNSTNGYNETTFQYIQATTEFEDGTTVSIRFNNQSCSDTANNSCAQYYQFINDHNVMVTDNIYVLPKLDYTVRVSVQTFSNDRLDGSKVRLLICNNNTGGDCSVVQQLLTPDYPNGVNVYFDRDQTYVFVVSHEGYETMRSDPIRGIDLVNEESIAFTLAKISDTLANEYVVQGPLWHRNESALYYKISYEDNTNFVWNTSINGALTLTSITNGGTVIILEEGTHHNEGEDVTLYIYSIEEQNNTISSYTLEKTYTTQYDNTPQRQFEDDIVQDNKLIEGLLFVFLILGSSLIGYKVGTSMGVDGGWGVFAIGSTLLGIFYTAMLPVAITTMILVTAEWLKNALPE